MPRNPSLDSFVLGSIMYSYSLLGEERGVWVCWPTEFIQSPTLKHFLEAEKSTFQEELFFQQWWAKLQL